MARFALKGSDKAPVPGARAVGQADPTERLEVSVILRHNAGDELRDRVQKLARGDRSVGHVRREDFARQFGAEQADIDAVKKFAAEHGLATVEADQARRTVVLSGTVAAFKKDAGLEAFLDYPELQLDELAVQFRKFPLVDFSLHWAVAVAVLFGLPRFPLFALTLRRTHPTRLLLAFTTRARMPSKASETSLRDKADFAAGVAALSSDDCGC